LLLPILILTPLVGALLAAATPRPQWAKFVALASSLAVWVLGLSLWSGFDPADGGFQAVTDSPLVPALGIRLRLGIDGISLFLVQLTTFLTPLAILASFESADKAPRAFFPLFLALESTLLGTFLALDLVLFYICWELMLLPMFFLIGVWGGPGRATASMKFMLFTLLGSLPMLVAILWVGHVGGSFDYTHLLEGRLPSDVQFWCFLICALAFLVKVPVVPFHAWLPDAYAEAPAPVSAMLAGVLSKMGAYGLLRICIPLFPDASQDFAPLMMGLGVFGVAHGALAAAAQTDMKRLIAYSSLSHMGLVVLAIFSFDLQASQGGLLQMVSHGLAIGALFLLVGMLYDRTRSQEDGAFGGLAEKTPVLAVVFFIATLAAVGFPGLCSFASEFIVLSAVWRTHPVLVVLSVSSVILGAWYLFTLYGRVFLGPVRHAERHSLKDLSLREGILLLPFLLLFFYVGIKPTPFLRPMEKSVQLGILNRLPPPPKLMDFAIQEMRERERKVALEEAKDKAKEKGRAR